jgi:hypothetical protein
VRVAATLDPLTGRGRHAQHVARDGDGRSAWERAIRYGRRDAAEWTFSRLKRVLGAGLRSRGLDTRRVEASIAVRALNRTATLACRGQSALCDREAPQGAPANACRVMHQSRSKPVHLLVDSTGLRLCGPSEWLTETHGARARRSWKKLQLGVDADTGRIVAAESTGKDADDGARVGPSLGTPGGTVDLRTGALGGRGRMT